MAAPSIRFYDSGGTAISAQQMLSAIAGTPGTAVNIQIWNNKDGTGADDAINWRLVAAFRTSGDPNYLTAGHEWADNHYLEFRILGGLGGLTAAPTGFKALGANSVASLPILGNNEGLDCEFRLNPEANAQDATGAATVEMKITPVGGNAEPISRGVTFATGAGIYLPMRDTEHFMLTRPVVLVENAAPDTVVDVGNLEVVIDGQTFVQLQHDETLAASGAGDERYDLLTVDAAGTVQVTAGAEVTAPVTESDKPAIPSDEIPLAFVFIDENGTIVDADIDTTIQEVGLYGFSSEGLVATIGPGPHAVVDDALLTHQRPTDLTLTASSTNRIWLKRDGSFEVTLTAARPSTRAMLLHVAVTDGSDVTSSQDHRAFIGFERHTELFNWPDDTVDQYRMFTSPQERDLLLLPDSIVAMILTAGATGSIEFDVEYWNGSSWVSLFTAGDLPEITSADGDNSRLRGFFPSTNLIPAGSLCRASVATAFATGTPADAALLIQFAT